MSYRTAQDWLDAPRRRVALFGMSGLGKTHVSNLLREGGAWFHYSVDFRIGTRYMGEHIVDNFKREAMRNPFLRELLMSDSIYIASNLTFKNLSPLSTYLGKPGDPDKGGIPFEEYVRRQRLHREAEIAATLDALAFADKAEAIYGYSHFVCDTSGSLCEVVDPDDPEDPVLQPLSAKILPVWIRGTEAHVEALAARFDRAPKPMYYQEDFLRAIWAEYLAAEGVAEARVDPDAFIRWGFRRLLEHRLPIYAAIAERWGVTVEAEDIAQVSSAHDFERLIARALPSGGKAAM
ncbi:ATPase [Rhodobacteraceae bacterium 2CG4]|uniref:ATPase n=1 Tax=Halovulum marinum TaxID=2662447 RepID=A0A6L5Z322_9RHOB|nr:ATPase [Halovulum marinum]MSU90991.1 ATPase [Halovulum marinum]